ncbi:hypothetical protein GQ42DRAFT_30306 [Ramicandelaber brevisporus]|nr:hypothetical protein GQ42DRAFT_30306 [Ramicandelaber brevisporus]
MTVARSAASAVSTKVASVIQRNMRLLWKATHPDLFAATDPEAGRINEHALKQLNSLLPRHSSAVKHQQQQAQQQQEQQQGGCEITLRLRGKPSVEIKHILPVDTQRMASLSSDPKFASSFLELCTKCKIKVSETDLATIDDIMKHIEQQKQHKQLRQMPSRSSIKQHVPGETMRDALAKFRERSLNKQHDSTVDELVPQLIFTSATMHLRYDGVTADRLTGLIRLYLRHDCPPQLTRRHTEMLARVPILVVPQVPRTVNIKGVLLIPPDLTSYKLSQYLSTQLEPTYQDFVKMIDKQQR